jgi:hypothetical protein
MPRISSLLISQVVAFEDLGFEETDEDIFNVYFREIELGKFNATDLRFISASALPQASEHKQTMEMTECGKHGKL